MRRSIGGPVVVIGSVNLLVALAFMHRYTLASLIGASTLLGDLGMTASQAGFLSSLYFGAYGSMQVPSGSLTDRINPRLLLSAGAAMVVASLLLFAAAPNYPVALASRVVLGVGMGLLFLPGLKLAAGWVRAQRYGALVGSMVALSTITAPIALLLLPLPLASFGWRWTLILLAIPIVPFVLLVHWLATGPMESTAAATRSGPVSLAGLIADWRTVWQYRRFRTLVLVQLVWEGMNFSLVTWLPRYAVEALGQSQAASGLLAGLNLFGFVGGAALSGWLTSRFSRSGRPLFLSAAVVYAILLGLLAVLYPLTRQTPLLIQMFVFLMGAAAGNYPAGYIPIAQAVPRQYLFTANGIFGAAPFVGGAIAPWLVGLIMDGVDRPTVAGAVYSAAAYNAAFGVCAAILAVWLVLVLALDRSARTTQLVPNT